MQDQIHDRNGFSDILSAYWEFRDGEYELVISKLEWEIASLSETELILLVRFHPLAGK